MSQTHGAQAVGRARVFVHGYLEREGVRRRTVATRVIRESRGQQETIAARVGGVRRDEDYDEQGDEEKEVAASASSSSSAAVGVVAAAAAAAAAESESVSK